MLLSGIANDQQPRGSIRQKEEWKGGGRRNKGEGKSGREEEEWKGGGRRRKGMSGRQKEEWKGEGRRRKGGVEGRRRSGREEEGVEVRTKE